MPAASVQALPDSVRENEISEIGLCNDNWYGYVERWIYEKKVTWMEKLVQHRFGLA